MSKREDEKEGKNESDQEEHMGTSLLLSVGLQFPPKLQREVVTHIIVVPIIFPLLCCFFPFFLIPLCQPICKLQNFMNNLHKTIELQQHFQHRFCTSNKIFRKCQSLVHMMEWN